MSIRRGARHRHGRTSPNNKDCGGYSPQEASENTKTDGMSRGPSGTPGIMEAGAPQLRLTRYRDALVADMPAALAGSLVALGIGLLVLHNSLAETLPSYCIVLLVAFVARAAFDRDLEEELASAKPVDDIPTPAPTSLLVIGELQFSAFVAALCLAGAYAIEAVLGSSEGLGFFCGYAAGVVLAQVGKLQWLTNWEESTGRRLFVDYGRLKLGEQAFFVARVASPARPEAVVS
jgi:hypothetical protein